MLLLAVETSTARSSVALGTEDGVLAAAELGRDRRHGEFASPAIAELLHHAGRTIDEVTHVTAGIGPGLYTGLRVGLVTATTVAATRDLPCVAVAGPDAIAHRVRHSGRRIAVALDARRREVYLAEYEAGPVAAARTGELEVGTPDDAARALLEDPRPLLLVGDGAEPVATRLRELADQEDRDLDLHVGGSDTAQPVAADLVPLALAAIDRGEAGGPELLRPLYLREADARIGWEERGRLRGGGGR